MTMPEHDRALMHSYRTDTDEVVGCPPECPAHSSDVVPLTEMGAPLVEPPAVYRQCNDPNCQAHIFELPHSHYEEVAETERLMEKEQSRYGRLQDFQARWNAPAKVEIKPRGLGQFLDMSEYVHLPNPLVDESTQEWYSIPIAGLAQKISEYITWVETGMTKDVCKCEWIAHPEKGNIRGGDTALDCPAHSKEGLVLGFFAWLYGKPVPLQTEHPCTLGNIESIDTVRTCCGEQYPSHTAGCPERLCAVHGD